MRRHQSSTAARSQPDAIVGSVIETFIAAANFRRERPQQPASARLESRAVNSLPADSARADRMIAGEV
jgi:hypothetical protein